MQKIMVRKVKQYSNNEIIKVQEIEKLSHITFINVALTCVKMKYNILEHKLYFRHKNYMQK